MTLDAIWQWFVQPLQYDFMVKALVMSAVVGLVCAVLSCYLILKGWSLMGDAVSHSVLPGVVVSYVLGLPFSIGAFVFGFLSVLTIGFVKPSSSPACSRSA
jgi:manganese transport system permease protein